MKDNLRIYFEEKNDGAMHYIYQTNRLPTTQGDSTYLG